MKNDFTNNMGDEVNDWNFDVLPQDEHNRALLDNVHPDDWENLSPLLSPRMPEK